MNIRKLLLIMLVVLPFVEGTAMQIAASNDIIQGDRHSAQIVIVSDTILQGGVTFSLSNLDSSSSGFQVSTSSWSGSGPYTLEYTWNVYGKTIGQYSLGANFLLLNGTTIAQVNKIGNVNSSAPKITEKFPMDIIPTPSTTLRVKTDEKADCSYGNANGSSNTMNIFRVTGGLVHTHVLSGLSQTKYTYYVSCKDKNGYEMPSPEIIEFIVDFPPSAEISLSDDSPVKEGTVEVIVYASEDLDKAPDLFYSFNDQPNSKRIISLTGENNVWKGFMIITKDDDNKVGTFHFEGIDRNDNKGTLITEGKIFLVDTAKPPAPVNIETAITPEGNVRLRWYYEGEPVESFVIHRTTHSGVDYIDSYVEIDNGTQFIDKSVQSKVTYYYKVSALDKSGNMGLLSEEVFATPVKEGAIQEEKKIDKEEPKVLPPNLVLMVNDEIKKVEQLEIDLEVVSDNLDSEKRALYEVIQGIKRLNEAQAKVSELKGTLEQLKDSYRTLEELNAELTKINMEMRKIRQTVPKNVILIEKAEFIQSVSKDDIVSATDLIFPELESKERASYVNKMKKVQEDIAIEAKAEILRIEFMDESGIDKSIITKKISYLNPESLRDVLIIENIPKTVSETTDEIQFITDGVEIIKKDPIVKWGFISLNFEGRTISYSFDRKIDLNKVKDIKSVPLVGPTELEVNTQIVGYSVFNSLSLESLDGAEKLLVYFGLSILVLLSVYYVVFIRNSNVRFTHVKKRVAHAGKKITSIPHIQKLKEHVLRTTIKKSDPLDIGVIKELIAMANEYLSMEDYDKASMLYPKVQILYKQLSPEFKKEIYLECAKLQKNILQAKQDSYQSVF